MLESDDILYTKIKVEHIGVKTFMKLQVESLYHYNLKIRYIFQTFNFW